MTRAKPFHLHLTAVILGMVLPDAADAYTARNQMIVEDIGNSTFEVVSRRGRTGARDYWCAAGDFATARRFPAGARIFLVRAPGPSVTQPERKAVQFTMQPDAAGIVPISQQLSLTVTTVGDNLSVALAREYCHPERSGP